MKDMNEAWKKYNRENQFPADKWIFKAGYEAGYLAAKKEAQVKQSFLKD